MADPDPAVRARHAHRNLTIRRNNFEVHVAECVACARAICLAAEGAQVNYCASGAIILTRYVHAIVDAAATARIVAQAPPKLCPVCQDGACETKSSRCGR